jgi:hypothetical protein
MWLPMKASLALLVAGALGCIHPNSVTTGADSSVADGPASDGLLDGAVVAPRGSASSPDGPTGEPPDAAPDSVTASDAAEVGARPGGPMVLSIAGTPVPREKAIVLLHIGHSQMAGRAIGPAALLPFFYAPDSHLWKYEKGASWTPAKEPLCGDGGSPGFPQGAGPGMALLQTARALAPDAYIISIGKAASLDFNGDCFSFLKGGRHYEAVMGPALELQGKVTFGGLFAMFSYDARTDPRAQNGGFLQCLKTLVEQYRQALNEPDLPFVEGDYEREAKGAWVPDCCGAPGAIAQIAQIPAAIPHSVVVPTGGLEMQDDHHYDLAGQKAWAERAFQRLAAAGMLPWAAAR